MGQLRKLIPRFSLRTLAIFTLLCTSGILLWWHWKPWYCDMALTGHKGMRRFFLLYYPDGRRILSDGWDGTARVWDTHTGEELHVLRSYRHGGGARFNLDGSRICTSAEDGAYVWDAETGERLLHLKCKGEPARLIFSPWGDLVLTSSASEIGVWTATGQRLKAHEKAGSLHGFYWADRRHVIIGHRGNTPRLLDLFTGKQRPLRGIADGPRKEADDDVRRLPSIGFHPDPGRVITLEEDGTARLRDAETLEPVPVKLRRDYPSKYGRPPEWPYISHRTPDGEREIHDNEDSVSIHEVTTGELLQIIDIAPGTVQFAPDGRGVITSFRDGKILFYRRRRPEWWWGVFWLKEFWATALFAGVFVWSVVRDRKALRGQVA